MGQNSHSTAESDAIPASKPHGAGKNSAPLEIRSHFNRKTDLPSGTPIPLSRKTSAPKSGPPPLLWGNGVSGDESPPTFVGEPALFRVNQPHPGGAAGNPRVTAPGGKTSSQIENRSHAPDEPRPAQTRNPHFCGKVTILSDDRSHFRQKTADFTRCRSHFAGYPSVRERPLPGGKSPPKQEAAPPHLTGESR